MGDEIVKLIEGGGSTTRRQAKAALGLTDSQWRSTINRLLREKRVFRVSAGGGVYYTIEDKPDPLIEAAETLGGIDSTTFTVGITDRNVAEYASRLEMDYSFIRDSFDHLAPRIADAMDETLARALDGDEDALAPMSEIAIELAETMRGAVIEDGLIDTGALRDSFAIGVSKK